MVKISASDVKNLREATGAGMMDCKNALVEAEGNFDKAIDVCKENNGSFIYASNFVLELISFLN